LFSLELSPQFSSGVGSSSLSLLLTSWSLFSFSVSSITSAASLSSSIVVWYWVVSSAGSWGVCGKLGEILFIRALSLSSALISHSLNSRSQKRQYFSSPKTGL
jgi:hypothetical protein